MPKVTDKQYQLENFLIEKMDLAAFRINKRKLDSIFIIDGDEGFGKTGISTLLAYYLAHKTGREFNLNHIFFDPKELINYINSTKKQVIVWDEAALGGLASSWHSRVQQMLIQTLMTCRSRQHIIFFNCPKFYRLNFYFVAERPLGLIHVYSEDGLNAGKVAFYKKDWLESMMHDWYKRKQKPYKKFYKKQLRGNFIDAFKLDIINEEQYDKKKDYFTEKILAQYSDTRYNQKALKLQYGIYKLEGVTQEEKCKVFGVGQDTISSWSKIPSKYPEMFDESK